MKLHLVLLTALFCSSGAHETAPSRKLSKKRSRSDKQRLVALKMDTTDIFNDSSEEQTDTDNIPYEFTDAPKQEENAAEPILERQPLEAQVMLGNVDIDDLTAEEAMFFESSLRKAIQLAQDQEQGQEDEVTIGAILVENGHGTHKHDGRALRGGKLPWVRFDIWALLETLRCRFCPSEDDDDDYSFSKNGWTVITRPPTNPPTPAPTPAPYYSYSRWYRYGWKNKNTKTPSPTPKPTPAPRPAWDDDDDDALSWYNNMLRGRDGGGRRHLGLSESNTTLEEILCKLLRKGPHERFHSVDKCALEVSPW